MSDIWKNHIAYWRKRAGMSQEALAHGLSEPTTKGTISQYESGKRTPSVERLFEIARVLNCKPGELLDGPPGAASKMPTGHELMEMIQRAMAELPVGVTFADYPSAVSTSLRAQLERYQAAGGFQQSQDEVSAPGKGVRSHAATKKSARVESRSQ